MKYLLLIAALIFSACGSDKSSKKNPQPNTGSEDATSENPYTGIWQSSCTIESSTDEDNEEFTATKHKINFASDDLLKHNIYEYLDEKCEKEQFLLSVYMKSSETGNLEDSNGKIITNELTKLTMTFLEQEYLNLFLELTNNINCDVSAKLNEELELSELDCPFLSEQIFAELEIGNITKHALQVEGDKLYFSKDITQILEESEDGAFSITYEPEDIFQR